MKKFILSACLLLGTIMAVRASSIKTDSSSVYEVSYQKHAPGIYNNSVPYIAMGGVLALLLVLGYVYWKNGLRND